MRLDTTFGASAWLEADVPEVENRHANADHMATRSLLRGPMTITVLPIRLEGRWVLVRAEIVREFLSTTPWLSVPGATPLVPGVMTWRGRAIPVLDLPRVLDFGTLSPSNECLRVMVVEHAVGAVAIPVDGAREVQTLSDDEIRPSHVSTVPYMAGEVDSAGEIIPLIEIDQVLREVAKVGG